jgi:purine-binding chemotaxis protein CheW
MSETSPIPSTGTVNPARVRAKKYLIFRLDEEQYAIPLSQVKEVIALCRITPVPQMPAFFKGLINLRGRVISTFDFREKLGLGRVRPASKRPCIIVTEISDFTLGAIVDDVCEVMGIDEARVERNLDIQSKVSREYVIGAARFESRPLILLLDIAKVLSVDELNLLKNQNPNSKDAA